MYWNETIETMDTERLRALQDERLREQVRYTYDRVPFYKKMFDDAGAQPGDIRTGFTCLLYTSPSPRDTR